MHRDAGKTVLQERLSVPTAPFRPTTTATAEGGQEGMPRALAFGCAAPVCGGNANNISDELSVLDFATQALSGTVLLWDMAAQG